MCGLGRRRKVRRSRYRFNADDMGGTGEEMRTAQTSRAPNILFMSSQQLRAVCVCFYRDDAFLDYSALPSITIQLDENEIREDLEKMTSAPSLPKDADEEEEDTSSAANVDRADNDQQ